MDVYIRLCLYFLFTVSTQAGPLFTASLGTLTPYLAETIPTCAQPCLQAFVADSFPSTICSSPSLNCLCTSDSETGYTIGEGALTCIASDCPDWDQDEAISAYEVCSNVVGAVSNTHSIITATHTAVTTVSNIVSTTPSTSSSTISTTSSRRSVHSSSSTSTMASSNTFTSTAASTSATATSTLPPSSPAFAAPASKSSSAPPRTVLSTPEIAGIVVASIGAAALAFGLCFLLFCCRRRKQVKRHSGSSFGGDKVVDSSVDSTPDLAILAARDWGHDPEGKEVVEENRQAVPPQSIVTTFGADREGEWSQWRRNTAPQDIGLALAPGVLTTGHPSPVTPSSRRTRNSQLLPEKPSYSLFPRPLQPSPHSRRASQSHESQIASRETLGKKPSPPTASSSRFPNSIDTSQTNMQGELRPYNPSSPLQIFPHMQAARSQAGYQPFCKDATTTEPTEEPHWSESPGLVIGQPLPAHTSPSARGLRLGQSIHSQYTSNSHPYPPPPPPLHIRPSSGTSNHTPRRKKSDPRPATWFSTGSETSFEDADVEDFPEPISALTPVKEQHSPITYPRVPIAAAESPTRRPEMPDRSDSLLARRRGEGRAAELTNGIQPRGSPRIVRQSAKSQILQSPVLSEPLASGSSTSNSPRWIGRGAGMTSPPSGWPARR